MKGKILYAGNFKLPDKNAAAHRVLANSKILAKLGYELILVGVSDEIRTGYMQHSSSSNKIRMFSVPYPRNLIEWIRFYISNKYLNEVIKSNQDLKYFIGYNYQSLSFLKLYIRFRHKIKFISDITEWYQPNDKSYLLRTLKKMDTEFRMRFINSILTDGNIVISRFLDNYYMRSKNLKLPPLVDMDEDRWIRREYDISEKVKFIFFGTIGGKKEELGLVLKFFNYILKKNPKFELHIFGNNKGELNNEGYQLADNIYAHGRVTHKIALTKVFESKYSIFFREENLLTKAGFPTKFVESLAAGTPVITNLSSNLYDYLVNNENGYIINLEKLKADDFSEIDKLSFSKKSNKLMKELALNTAWKNFHYENYIENTENFLKSL